MDELEELREENKRLKEALGGSTKSVGTNPFVTIYDHCVDTGIDIERNYMRAMNTSHGVIVETNKGVCYIAGSKAIKKETIEGWCIK